MKGNKFISGPGHIFNPVPQNEEESLQHGNALAKSGNYPVGTSGCFNVGISGGCGPECYVYQEGDCDVSGEIIERIGSKYKDWTLKQHYEIYPQDQPKSEGVAE